MGEEVKDMKINKLMVSVLVAGLMALYSAISVFAASTIIVTPSNTQGWSTADTRPGGSVSFVVDPTSPAPNGALQLITDATTTSKAQYLHAANTPLSAVTELSYYTKQVAAPFPGADPSYQLITYLNGGTAGFTTLVFEPYQNPGNNGNASVVPNVWQKWDVAQGLFWSTRTVTCSNGTIAGTPGGPASYTLAQVKSICPNALVAGFGVNIGTNNPGYTVRTDLFNFNGTTYNFEVTNTPTNKNQCKNGGFVNYTDASGKPFKNQGQCVRFVENHKDEKKDEKDDDSKDHQGKKDDHKGPNGDDNVNNHDNNNDNNND